MPDIFKALATIMAWGFWIGSWCTLLIVLIKGSMTGTLWGPEPPPMIVPVFFLVALAQGVSAVVIMRLRQKME